jgi:hypothetical protein
MINVDEVVSASDLRNGGRDGATRYTLGSMKAHADEISELYSYGDPHYKEECADMIIHCLCMLRRAGMGEKEISAILEKRKKRFLERIAGKP